MNSTLNLINNRVSLRRYDNRQISEEDLSTIIDATLRAPTAGNMMLYSILVVKEEEKKKKLSKTCDNQPFIAKAPAILIFLADMQRLNDYFNYCNVKEYCDISNMQYKEPNLGGLFLGVSDALIAAQTSVLAAESIGIGSVYIGDIVENYEIHREMLNLPDYVFPIGMLCLGYYPENIKRITTPRFDKKYIVHNEEYKKLTDTDFEEMYKERDKKIQSNKRCEVSNYGQFIYTKKFGTDFMDEMNRSISVIINKWGICSRG